MEVFGICGGCKQKDEKILQFLFPCNHAVCENCMDTIVQPVTDKTKHIYFLPCGRQVDAKAPLGCPKCRRRTHISDVMMKSLDAMMTDKYTNKEGFTVRVHQPTVYDDELAANVDEKKPDVYMEGMFVKNHASNINQELNRQVEVQTYGSSFTQTSCTQTKKIKGLQDKFVQWPICKDRSTQAGYLYEKDPMGKERLRLPGSEVIGCGPVSLRSKSMQTQSFKQDVGIQCMLSKCQDPKSVVMQVWSRRLLPGDQPVGPVCRYKKDASVQADLIDYEANIMGITKFVRDILQVIKLLMKNRNDKDEEESKEDLKKQPFFRWGQICKEHNEPTLGKGEGASGYSTTDAGKCNQKSMGASGDFSISQLPYPKVLCTASLTDPAHASCRMGTAPRPQNPVARQLYAMQQSRRVASPRSRRMNNSNETTVQQQVPIVNRTNAASPKNSSILPKVPVRDEDRNYTEHADISQIYQSYPAWYPNNEHPTPKGGLLKHPMNQMFENNINQGMSRMEDLQRISESVQWFRCNGLDRFFCLLCRRSDVTCKCNISPLLMQYKYQLHQQLRQRADKEVNYRPQAEDGQ